MNGKEEYTLNPNTTTSVTIEAEDGQRIICSIYNLTDEAILYKDAYVDSISVYARNTYDVVFPCGITFDTPASEALKLLGEPTKSYDSDYPSYTWRESDQAYCAKLELCAKKADDTITSVTITGNLYN